MKDEELIGKEVYGFKFPSGTATLGYNTSMELYEGVRGQITIVGSYYVRVDFPSVNKMRGNSWAYPKELVIEQLKTRSTETEIFKIL